MMARDLLQARRGDVASRAVIESGGTQEGGNGNAFSSGPLRETMPGLGCSSGAFHAARPRPMMLKRRDPWGGGGGALVQFDLGQSHDETAIVWRGRRTTRFLPERRHVLRADRFKKGSSPGSAGSRECTAGYMFSGKPRLCAGAISGGNSTSSTPRHFLYSGKTGGRILRSPPGLSLR